ncbi:phosphoenolpyruvate carboxylase [Algihabitans albus]|uniref:phosphoenolpyruvate carboxylase n=1 Tax=Algihabitans albus TaxID=2164067 RepID=UPI000E5C5E80|nr:phosphoenolpyruvate carboxylase [Algihabitans albus]
MSSRQALADSAKPAPDLLSEWRERLVAYRARSRQEPLFNPVQHLAFELSVALERGEVGLRDIAAAAKTLSDEALIDRAERLRRYLGLESDKTGGGADGAGGQPGRARLTALVRGTTVGNAGATTPFEDFAALWSRPEDGIVFTAHPTFAMSQALRELLTDLVEGRKPRAETERNLRNLPHRPDQPITLDSEHEQALSALAQAQDAVATLLRTILQVAQEVYPDRWRELRPAPISLATWVGYDLDGRNDITWVDSIRFRLQEKRWQLERYARRLENILAELPTDDAALAAAQTAIRRLREELQAVARQIAAFHGDLEGPAALTTAANSLTRRRDGGLGNSTANLIDNLNEAVEAAGQQEAARSFAVLRSEIQLHGLGAGLIHLRINAAQVHNAIRKPLGLAPATEMESRVLLNQLDRAVEDLPRETVNFASLALESATAVRQFIAIAQILKHIDGDKPIRLLIAECEHPFTPLAALYFARLFGVEDRVDISPLFETEQALEHGAALVESLLKTRSYRRYIGARGRLAVQTGFSDAGRFIGQVPAALAVERLQGQLAGVIEAAQAAEDLGEIEVLIFDTHGESMGRGAHPASFRDRQDYVLSPWVRQRYRARGIRLLHETSFQGGDGYVFFGRAELALAVLAGILEARLADSGPAQDDPFYAAYLFNRDLHERLRSFQTRLFAEADHSTLLTAFGTNLLVATGSRKTSRQFDGRSDSRVAAAALRAIPHNALLQQLGYGINLVAGLGSALRHDRETFAGLHARSDRLKVIVDLVRRARALSSLDTLAAYAALFDGAYWVARPRRERETGLKEGCLLLAEHLRDDPRFYAMLRLGSALREDAIHLDDLLAEIGVESGIGAEGGDSRRSADPALLQSLRLALIQHIFLLAARLPKFSTRHDMSQDDVIALTTRLRVLETTQLLRRIFPAGQPIAADYQLDEAASYRGAEAIDYAEMNRQLIDPMLSAFEIAQDLTVGISHCFGAYG